MTRRKRRGELWEMRTREEVGEDLSKEKEKKSQGILDDNYLRSCLLDKEVGIKWSSAWLQIKTI